MTETRAPSATTRPRRGKPWATGVTPVTRVTGVTDGSASPAQTAEELARTDARAPTSLTWET